MQGCFNSKVLQSKDLGESTVARDDPGSQCSEDWGSDMGCEDCVGLPDPPLGLKHLLPPVAAGCSWQSWNCFTQESLLKTGQWEDVYVPRSPPYSHQIWMVTQLQSCLWGHWCLCCSCLTFKASYCLILLPSLPLSRLILRHSQIKLVLFANLLISVVSWGAYLAKVVTRCCLRKQSLKRDFGSEFPTSQQAMRTTSLGACLAPALGSREVVNALTYCELGWMASW